MITFKKFLQLFEAEKTPIKVVYHPEFLPSYKAFLNVNGIRDALKEFFRCKKQWPQEKLIASFKDHALQGSYFKKHKILECHLAGDVLLLYRFDSHILNPLICCTHSDLKGGRIASLQKLLKL